MTARDRAAAAAGRGPRGRWVGRRLFAAAERGGGADADAARRDVARIAATPGHRLRERARDAVAVWWARDRDPFLRGVVLESGAVAPEPPWRLYTLALLGRLEQECGPHDALQVAGLLDDPDPDVRERTLAFCRETRGGMLQALWAVGPGPDSDLRRALLANPDPPSPRLVDRLWAEWLRRPDEALGEALVRWGMPAADEDVEPLSVVALGNPRSLAERRYRAAVVEAVTLGDHPLYTIAERRILGSEHPLLVEELCAEAMHRPELVPFCTRHGLAPKDPVKRALYFVLTGQPGQHRAVDPDGDLLSLAYASASKEERAKLQRVMVDAGDLDLVHVIVGDDRRARIPAMEPAEVRYLGEQLAARREWEELWALVQDVPIGSGVDLMRLFEGWAPRGEDARRIFEMYLETGPSSIRVALNRFPPHDVPLTRQARLLFRGRVNDVSFAPDGPYLAVAGTGKVAGVFDLRTAGLVERYEGFNSSVGRILHLGDGTLIAGERTNRVDRECRVVRCADGATQTLHTTPGSVTSLAAVDEHGSFVAATRAGNLVLGRPGGEPVTPVPVRSLGMRSRWPRSVAADTASRRLAVLGRGLVMAEVEARGSLAVVGEVADPYLARAAFVDADTLVCADLYGAVNLLRMSAEGFVTAGGTAVVGFGGLAASPALGQPVVVDGKGTVRVYDAATFDRRGHHSPAARQSPTGVTISPGGEFLAVGDAAGHTDLFDLRLREMPEILRRPLVDLVPRHLGIVGTALDTGDPAIRPVLLLLTACLEHRFRFDIEIGDAVRLTAGEHDISL